MTNGLLIYCMGKYLRISSYIRKPFLIYDFATAPLWISLYMRKFFYIFYQCNVRYYSIYLYRDSVTRFFASCFFHESSSPKLLKITLGSFRFFWKFAVIFASQDALPVSTTPVVHLELRIFSRIFKKNSKRPSGTWRKRIHAKTWSRKSRDTVPF